MRLCILMISFFEYFVTSRDRQLDISHIWQQYNNYMHFNYVGVITINAELLRVDILIAVIYGLACKG